VAEALDECPLGAAALAGSTLPLDRAFVAKQLGFKRVCENSMDAVSNRDYLVDFAYSLAMIMQHLSRLGEEVVLYTSQEYGFLKLADGVATGSSLMPQKRNPDVAELLRGRAGRAYGLLTHLLTMLNAEEDKKKREKIDARNTADALIFNLEKQMREHDSKINDAVKKKVNTKMNDLREVLKKDDASADDIKKATEALATEAQEIGKLVYEEAQKKAKEESAEKQDKDGPIDAEVVDEKEEDKKGKKKK
jgi:argininosuccinate lyase